MENTGLEIPLAILLVPYVIFLALFLFYVYFTCRNLLKYGMQGKPLVLFVTIFILGCVVLVLISFLLLSRFDWFANISVENILNPAKTQSIL